MDVCLARSEAPNEAHSEEELPQIDLLYPLSEFLGSVPSPPLEPREIAGERMPEPYRSLLVHTRDMTSTLEAHHGEELELRQLASRRAGASLLRQVVLVGRESARPYELGAIRIDLAGFAPAAQQAILGARRPLGAILADHAVGYESRPRLYFRLASAPWIERLFALPGAHDLYGRQNALLGAGGRTLAEVVEILPPAVG